MGNQYLSYSDYTNYASECQVLQDDIRAQMEFKKKASGCVVEAYEKIILDKIWSLQKKHGVFYQKCLALAVSMEAKVREETPQREGKDLEGLPGQT